MTLRLSAFILFLAVFPGDSQSTANTSGWADISPVRMRVLLQGMGWQFTEKPSDDSVAFTFPFNGHLITLLNHPKAIQLSTCVEDNVPPLKMNQWNREHFASRAVIDEQGCASLEADATFGGRVTNEMIQEFVAGFLTDVTIFARFVTELLTAPKEAASPASPAEHSRSPIGPMEWSQLGQNTKRVPLLPEATRSEPGLVKINRNISLKYDPERWRQTTPDNAGQLALAHSSGDGYALIIAEPMAVPRGSVEDIALANAQTVDPSARILFREQRRINGADVRFLKMEADVNAVRMAYWGCFYGGEYGTVQVVTYTAKALLPGYEKEFMDFLAGFTVSK